MKIGCIILAGGKSSRMGEDKALLEYNGKYFIEKIADTLSFFDEKIVARGDNSNLVEITGTDWKVIPDIYPDHGPMGGLHAALKECESEAMFVVTCDMPLITESLIKKICNELKANDAVIAVSDDGKYHPLCGIYRKNLYKYMEECLNQDQNRIMTVLKKYPVKYMDLDKEESEQLVNVNTKEEYMQLIG